jgi:predicted ATPase/class 3 adenylate cyclase/DNA-binding CsgD family transcriptional regulator
MAASAMGDAQPAPSAPGPTAAPLPAGTVTFLLTDIEGSSRMWEQDPNAAAAAVGRHDELLGAAITHHGGMRPVDQGEGDSMLAVFARAADAVAAALQAQRAIAAERWPTAEPLRVRMAIHTGDAQFRDDGNYAGPALNRCARLRDLGHGGQILLSRATHDLVCDHLPEGAAVRDLGSYQLRDLDRPEHVFQLCHAELSPRFPPLRSSAGGRTNLPHQLTTFVGRERELAALAQLVPASRLVTLTGAGGCGKTRLAVEVAAGLLDEFADGVWWVDLAALSDPDLLPGAVASAMGIPETSGAPLMDVLAGVLAGRRTLVVLDNCEHLVDACAALCQSLLEAGPRLVVLATSREPLGLEGETTWRVPSLTVAEETAPTTSLIDCEAARLFVDRAIHARPTFRLSDEGARTLVRICRRLDGIPLAIELAAARTRVLTLEQIAAGLDDRFRLLVSGRRTALSRQRTLEASVDWSYGLLEDDQRTLFRRLSVFAGTFDLEAAEAVGAGDRLEPHRVFDLLLQLVDRSLVQPHEDGGRYRLLETIRQYGWQKALDAGDVEVLRDRHLAHYAALAQRAGPLLEVGGTVAWLERLDAELDNLRAAMDWASTGGSAAAGLRLAAGCAIYWEARAHFAEARARMTELLERCDPDPHLRAEVLVALELMALDGSDVDGVVSYSEQAVELARAAGSSTLQARALTYRGGMMALADPAAAIAPLSEGLERAREAGDVHCANWAGQFLGAAHQQLGDMATARRVLDNTVAATRAEGDLYNLSGALYWRGLCHLATGRLADAERDFRGGCELASMLQDFTGRLFWVMVGLTVGLGGRHDEARAVIDDTVSVARETKNDFTLACGLTALAFLERATGDVDATAAAAEEATDLWRAMGLRGWLAPHALALLGWAAMRRGDLERAATALEEGLTASAGPPAASWVLVTQALVARRRGDALDAEDRARRCLAEVGAESLIVADALEALAGALIDLCDHEDAARILGAAAAVRTRQGHVRAVADEPEYQADLEVVRDVIGDEAFSEAWGQGAALSAEEAVAFATRGRGRRGRPAAGWESLTPTELEVVRLVAQGLTNPQIGQRLFVTPGTVKTHLAHVFAKVGVSTRAELATAATRRGI